MARAGDPLGEALALMTAWAREVDEQAFLSSHIRGLLADLEEDAREDALIVMITGLIIVAGGVLRLHAESAGVTVEDILMVLGAAAVEKNPDRGGRW